jgi:hypothetical protein
MFRGCLMDLSDADDNIWTLEQEGNMELKKIAH